MQVLTCECGNRLKVKDDAIGKSGRCPKCNAVVQIRRENLRPMHGVASGVRPAVKPPASKRIGELMIEAGVISEGQLRDALTVQKKRGGKLVEQLISLGHLDPDAFVDFLAKQPGIASLDLSGYRIPEDIVGLIPKEVAIEHEIFPIDRLGKLLTIGMVCPLDSATIQKIEDLTGLRVKPILCAPKDIRRALHEHFGDAWEGVAGAAKETPGKAASGIKLQRVSTLLKKMESLPALPETVSRVQEAMQDIKNGARNVAEIVQQDPPIAAQVLSVANSAAYGFPNQIGTVDLAVSLLGLKETYSIVTSAAVMNLFDKGEHLDYKKFWDEALTTGGAARRIVKAGRLKNLEGIFTCGLLHDIGRIALLETLPQVYTGISPELSGDELIEAEQAAFGITHTESGYELALSWSLPPEIAEAIRYHHAPEFAEQAPRHVAVVALAELWTRTHPAATSDKAEVLALTPEIFATLELDESAASKAYDEVAQLPTPRFHWATEG